MLVLAADIIYYKPLLSTKLLRKCSSYIDVVFNNLANANPPSEHILFWLTINVFSLLSDFTPSTINLIPLDPRLLPDKSKNYKGGETTNA